MQPKKQLLFIDGSSYIYRAFHAIPYLSNSKGLPTNAIYGFIQMLIKVIKDFKTDHIAVAFDVKGPSFRHKMYEQYKAHRPEMPDNLKPQIPYIKEFVRAFNIPVLELEGYEADDIIGTISKQMKEKDVEVIIIAADKDMLQLIDDNTTIVDTMKGQSFGLKEVMERFGTSPEFIIDIMGLTGDAADNIPGVKGIGEKTAVKLIQQFGTIENLLLNIDNIAEKGIREKLREQAENARLSKKLAAIDRTVPIHYKYEDLIAASPDYPRLELLLKELEFTKLVKQLIPSYNTPVIGEYTVVADIDMLKSLITEIKETKEMAIAIKIIETTFDKTVGLAICIKPKQAFYMLIALKSEVLNFKSEVLNLKSMLEIIKPIIENEGIKKISSDIKGVYAFFKQHQIQMRGVWIDIGIASYLLNPSNKKAEGRSEDIDDCSSACSEADAGFQIVGKLLPQLENSGLLKLFNEIEIPLTQVLAEMELTGIKVDKEYLLNISKELEMQIDVLKKSIYAIAGIEFNISSPKQLSEILFERLKLKPVKKTKTGFSTNEDVLKILAMTHELPSEVLNFRQLSKLKSTYVDAIVGLINPSTQMVHTSFNQTVTATGRLSSSEPNLQNIPIRTEIGKRIRRAFIADKGCLFLSADYSQIELRIAAHLSQDPLLLEAFQKDEDIHTKTASDVFGLAPELITEEMRRRAKAINFGIIYGMGPYGLGEELGISQEEARGYIENYFLHYKGVRQFIDKTINEAIETGYVTTLFGRRRYIPEIKSESDQIRKIGERIAINTPIQGTAADLIKIAMINIYKRLKEDGLCSKMLLQIHDELILEAPDLEIDRVRNIVKKEMETTAYLTVPIKVDIKIGSNWGELS